MQSDDPIAALMDQLRAQQGYDVPDPTTTNRTVTSSTTIKATPRDSQYQRLLPELNGYPSESHLVGNHSIWNPYISPSVEISTFEIYGTSGHLRNLPTNPQVEVIRRRAFEKFKQECMEVILRIQQPWEMKLPIPAMLEKWHMDSKLAEFQEGQSRKRDDEGGPQYKIETSTENQILTSTEEIYLAAVSSPRESQYMDPILLNKKASGLFCATFEPEVKKAWNAKLSTQSSSLPPKFGKKIEQIQKALYRCICLTLELFQQQLAQAVKLEKQQTQIQRNKSRRKLPKITKDQDTDQYRVTFAGIGLKIHAAYFEKLQRLFDRAHTASDQDSSQNHSFEEALFCLLCRYDMLQGAGLQAGVPGRVMDILLQQFDCRMECFASPLNCRYEGYASAFDIDRAFGSRGSFFDLQTAFFAAGGCFQANPPFCEGVIDAMNHRIHELLETCTTKPLMFVVFVPAWKQSKAYQEGLLENSFLTQHLLLLNGTHWYAEGTQHRRKGSFRPASFDTSILFYQNEAAKDKWPLQDQDLHDLKRAFCEDPGIMDKVSTVGDGKNSKTPTGACIQQSDETHVIDSGKDRVVSKRHEREHVPTSAERKPSNKKAKLKPDKRREWSNHNEESTAQLELLNTLGLSKDINEGGTVPPAPGTIAFKKRKKRK